MTTGTSGPTPAPRASATQRPTARRNSCHSRMRSLPMTAGLPGATARSTKSLLSMSKRMDLAYGAAAAEHIQGQHHKYEGQDTDYIAREAVQEDSPESRVEPRGMAQFVIRDRIRPEHEAAAYIPGFEPIPDAHDKQGGIDTDVLGK